MKKRSFAVFLICLLTVLSISYGFAGCTALAAESTARTKVTSIKLSKQSSTLKKGQTLKLKATIAPSTAASQKVTWKSSNKRVATVTSSGKVTAKGKGTATITCTAKDGSGKMASCKITVKLSVTGIRLNKSKATLRKGAALQLKAKVTPAKANNKKVSWKSSNKRVATVSKSGKVTAKGKGTATITCKAKDGSGKKAICKIKVTVPSSSARASVRPDSVSDEDEDGGGSSSGGDVWLSATGSKYHSINNCGRMNPDKAIRVSRSEAEARGYEPCSKCVH